MLLNEFLSDNINYAHVIAIALHDHEILIDDPDFFLIHSLVSDVYAVEARDESVTGRLFDQLSQIGVLPTISLLITTNQTIYNRLCNEFTNHYMCHQFVFNKNYPSDECAKLLKKEDLEFVKRTYSDSQYINQLFEHNRILGYYPDDKLVGYAVLHIDMTLGALYVDPSFRGHDYGLSTMKAAASYFAGYQTGNFRLYSHVISDNEVSLSLHRSIATEAYSHIYWMYNGGFSF